MTYNETKSELFRDDLIGVTLKYTNTFLSTSLHQLLFCQIRRIPGSIMTPESPPGLRMKQRRQRFFSEDSLGFQKAGCGTDCARLLTGMENWEVMEEGSSLQCHCSLGNGGTILGAEINFVTQHNPAKGGWGTCSGRERKHRLDLDVGAQRTSWGGYEPMNQLSELSAPNKQLHFCFFFFFFSLKFSYSVETATTPSPLVKKKRCTDLSGSGFLRIVPGHLQLPFLPLFWETGRKYLD